MSEPITLWDADGRQVTLYSPSEAHRLVQAGELRAVAPMSVTVMSPYVGEFHISELVPAADVVPVSVTVVEGIRWGTDLVPMSKRVGRPRKGE